MSFILEDSVVYESRAKNRINFCTSCNMVSIAVKITLEAKFYHKLHIELNSSVLISKEKLSSIFH